MGIATTNPKLAEQAKSPYKKGEKAGKDLRHRVAVPSIGTISRVIPGSYIMTAAIEGAAIPEVQCLYVPGMMSALFGAKDCSMPTEGTPVLMIAMPGDPKKRIAICSLPDELKGFKDLESLDWVSMFGSSPEPGVNYWSLDSYVKEASDTKKLSHVPAGSDRPTSMLPGEWAQGNPMGVFLAVFHFMATLKATERAKLECFVFDDLVRLTSGQFQHWNAFGETHIFDDAGMTNVEVSGSHTAPEVRGYNDPETMVTHTEDPSAEDERDRQNNPDVVMKRRFRMFMGGLGDMCQIYLRNMQDGNSPDTYGAQEAWGASFKMQLDNSGAVSVSSAAGIGLSLNDKIPVPKRVKAPWDPEGDKVETMDSGPFNKKEHFDYDDDTAAKYPYMRNIKAMDAEPWEDALSYQRFDELSKDFVTPEASELDDVPGKYDALGSDSRQDKYRGRKAGFKVEQDGSVRIWGNWGEEVYMRGGDIVLSCPGNIIMQPGKAVIGMADNVILKAKTGVDISACDHDVRISAGRDVLAYSGTGGILLESAGTAGITLKAVNAGIQLWAQRLTSYVDYFMIKALESIVMSAKSLAGVFTESLVMETEGKAGISLNRSSAQLLGASITVAAGDSVNIFKGSQYMVPMNWADTQQNPYESSVTGVQAVHSQFSEEGAWLGALQSDRRDDIKFEYRTSEQYGTTAGTEVYMPPSEFTVYQTRWQLLAKLHYKFIQGTTEAWTETAVNDTYPWPGNAARDRAYASVDSIANVDAVTMTPNDRQELVKKFASNIQRSSLDNYIIMK